MTDNDALVRVEQIDRDAVAAWAIGDKIWTENSVRDIERGYNDNWPVVQAFARHRLAALRSTPQAEPVRGITEAESESLHGALLSSLEVEPPLDLPAQDEVEVVAGVLYETGFPDRRWSNVDDHNRQFWSTHATAAIAALDHHRAGDDALREENARLREALEPFAKMAKYLHDTEQRRDTIYCGGSPGLACEVTAADYHRALAALTGRQG